MTLSQAAKLLENDKSLALAAICRARTFVQSLKEDKPLTLKVGYDLPSEKFTADDTSTNRELVYNIEHAVHHLAIIRISIRPIASSASTDHESRIAASTFLFARAGGSDI